MFFSKSARILAILAFVFGLLSILNGLLVLGIEPKEARVLYLGSKSPGQVIDRGIYTILFAVALGTLAEISFSMRKGSTAPIGQGASAAGQK